MRQAVFPFTAIVGQERMKRALVLNAVNPSIGGVLIRGERGTAKSTAARALAALLPDIEVVADCRFGCDPIQPEHFCDECRERAARGEELPVKRRRTRLIDLPISATEDRVVGTLDLEQAIQKGERHFDPGVLAAANRGILYVDEVNLLDDDIVNAILDAAAQGSYTVRRGPLTNTYRARFTLIGSMNPEEGALRPQIMDRFGLRVIVSGLGTNEERREVTHRVQAFQDNRYEFVARLAEATEQVANEINLARARLTHVTVAPAAERLALELVSHLRIHSSRAEIVTLQAARARAAADERETADVADVAAVAPMALRLRYSSFIAEYIEARRQEDTAIQETLESLLVTDGPEGKR